MPDQSERLLLSSKAGGLLPAAQRKASSKRAPAGLHPVGPPVGSPAATRNPNLRPPWKKGQSGNPSGYPARYAELIAVAREHSGRALARLAELMESADERVATVAAQTMLERAWGKAREFPDAPPVERGKVPDLRRLTLKEQGIFTNLLEKALTESSDSYPNRFQEYRKLMDSA